MSEGDGMASGEHDRCKCGHDRSAHEHYRKGSECALCPADHPCSGFRPTTWWGRLRGLL